MYELLLFSLLHIPHFICFVSFISLFIPLSFLLLNWSLLQSQIFQNFSFTPFRRCSFSYVMDGQFRVCSSILHYRIFIYQSFPLPYPLIQMIPLLLLLLCLRFNKQKRESDHTLKGDLATNRSPSARNSPEPIIVESLKQSQV